MLELLNLRTVAFSLYQKKRISFSSLYFLYFKWSNLKQMFRNDLISLFFFQNIRLFLNRIFLSTFQIKI